MKRTLPEHHPAAQGIRAAILGILVNLVLAVVKGTAGVLGHSYALIADAVESATDIFSSLILWVGLDYAAREPDEDHPYGHGKAEPLAAIAVSLLVAAAGISIAVQGFINIFNPHQPPASFTAIVLILVIVIKEGMFRFVEKTAENIQSTAVKGDAWHHRSDAITSLAALIGIVMGIFGGPKWAIADDIAAMVAAIVIGYNAWNIFLPAFREVMDTAQPDAVVDEIRAIASAVPDVVAVEKCFVRKTGLDFYVDIHVVVDGNLTVRRGHEIAHEVKDAIMQQRPRVLNVLTHIEPAV